MAGLGIVMLSIFSLTTGISIMGVTGDFDPKNRVRRIEQNKGVVILAVSIAGMFASTLYLAIAL